MADIEIRSRDRVCSETGAELGPGSTVYSCLVRSENGEEIADIKRLDFCVDAWTDPPEGCISWWKSHIPERHSDRIYWAPNSVILSYFHELRNNSEQAEVFFLLTLLMIRKRILRMDEASREDNNSSSMLVVDPADDQEYQVPVVEIPAERSAAIQEQLCELLFSNEPPTIDED